MNRTRERSALAALVTLLPLSAARAPGQQAPDADFDTRVAKPAYTDTHPRVLFDIAHHNFHTPDGRYKPFAELMRSDGCEITPNREKFTAESLKGYDVLIIANALGAAGLSHPDASKPAFTPAECEAVRRWVHEGGAILLIADHAPIGSANAALGKTLGVEMSTGTTLSEPPFTREAKTLGDHPITRGRDDGERINTVRTFTGQTLKGPDAAAVLLKLPDGAQENIPDKEDPANNPPQARSAGGRAMGLAYELGKGRVVVLGEAAMLSAQKLGDRKFGMNVEGTDNRQFALNMMHWLTGLLK
jgi:hypothetical protein